MFRSCSCVSQGRSCWTVGQVGVAASSMRRRCCLSPGGRRGGAARGPPARRSVAGRRDEAAHPRDSRGQPAVPGGDGGPRPGGRRRSPGPDHPRPAAGAARPVERHRAHRDRARSRRRQGVSPRFGHGSGSASSARAYPTNWSRWSGRSSSVRTIRRSLETTPTGSGTC